MRPQLIIANNAKLPLAKHGHRCRSGVSRRADDRAIGVGMRAVLFDYFHTLADPESHVHEHVTSLLGRHGVTAEPAAVYEAWAMSEHPDVARALDGPPPPFVTMRDRWRELGEPFLATHGIDNAGADWADCRRDAHRVAAVYDDVQPSLAKLRAAGLVLGVLSDADNDFLLPSIESNGLDFDTVISSEERGCYKPHRSLFVTACSSLRVAPADAIYVGDNPYADIVGARNAGLTTAWINRAGRSWPEALEPPDHVITTIAELPAIAVGRATTGDEVGHA